MKFKTLSKQAVGAFKVVRRLEPGYFLVDSLIDIQGSFTPKNRLIFEKPVWYQVLERLVYAFMILLIGIVAGYTWCWIALNP